MSDTTEAINLGSVISALREIGMPDRPTLADEVFGQLRQAGIKQAHLRYASHCLKIRRQKTKVDNPLAYWIAIAKYQHGASTPTLKAV